ncbi:NAD(P)-binding domain-containing protein [Ottowia sp. VDI28]|uniref:NAD(P)-binding domain-containing protein n=1 Tax=Ottowia sp. VDI28 TaxID=3133968 RepID=UPI003C2C3981
MDTPNNGFGPDIRIGLIGTGQLGLSLASSLIKAGARHVIAHNVPADEAARARAEGIGAVWSATAQGLRHAQVVFSAVTPMAAVSAAQACAPELAPDAVYVDLNSMGPVQKRAVADAVARAGRKFVDGAVLGAAADGIRMPIILAGPEAQRVAGSLSLFGMNARAVGHEPGQASAIKIVRSVLAKGLETLYVEALLAATRMNVEQEVLGTFCDWLDARPAAATAELLVTTHLLHAQRRMHELDMSIEAVREAGVEPVMARAVRNRLAMTAGAGVAAQLDGKPPDSLAQALEMLNKTAGLS